jgi:MFS family permease
MLFSISGFTAAALALFVGVLADRFGRKPFIILIALMMATGSAALTVVRNYALIVSAAALGTIGFVGPVGGGGWGPSYPAAQSLVAEHAGDEYRTMIFGVLSFIGVLAGSAGSLTAALPRFLNAVAGVSMLTGFRLLFLLAALMALLMAIVMIPVHEFRYSQIQGLNRNPGSEAHQPKRTCEETGRKWLGLSTDSWRLVSRFMVTSATNGLALGMMGPFVVYWFYKRFGARAAELGQLYFIINICAALPYLMTGRVSRRFGAVVTIVSSRLTSAAMLAAVVMMPTYTTAATLYVIRVLVAVFAIPIRQSFLMGVIEPAERSSAAGFANTPSQVSQSLSAYGAGILIHYVGLSMPLLAASAFQSLNALLYYLFFRNVRPPEELDAIRTPETEALN